jgi:hypothetical protein
MPGGNGASASNPPIMPEFSSSATGCTPRFDGIWATAPYFHNGSVPTIYHVLKSGERPRISTRSFRGDAMEYDQRRVGLKFQTLAIAPDPSLPAIDRRKVYDITQPGWGNGGHTFGDRLTEE